MMLRSARHDVGLTDWPAALRDDRLHLWSAPEDDADRARFDGRLVEEQAVCAGAAAARHAADDRHAGQFVAEDVEQRGGNR